MHQKGMVNPTTKGKQDDKKKKLADFFPLCLNAEIRNKES